MSIDGNDVVSAYVTENSDVGKLNKPLIGLVRITNNLLIFVIFKNFVRHDSRGLPCYRDKRWSNQLVFERH